MIPWKSLCCVAIPISLLKTYHKFWNKSPQGNLDPNLTITKRNTWYDSCILIYVLYVFKPLQCLTTFQFVKVLNRWKNFLVSYIFSCYLQTYVPLCHNFPLRKSPSFIQQVLVQPNFLSDNPIYFYWFDRKLQYVLGNGFYKSRVYNTINGGIL